MPANPSTLPVVLPGQVWADNDKRCAGRTVTVLEVHERTKPAGRYTCGWYAVVEDSRGSRTEIRVDRFRPTSTGYRLVKDVDHLDAIEAIAMCHFAQRLGEHPADPRYTPCCSSHGKPLCCHHYRWSHFVETGCDCCPDGQAIKAEMESRHA